MNQKGRFGTIESFTDLNAWKEGHKLVLDIYSLTRKFPKEELFCLTSQMRRCVVSITSNIAEGFSRQTYKDKAHFYSISLGSTTELQNQIIISRDLDYFSKNEFEKIFDQTVIVHKIINVLIKSSKSFC